MQLSDRQLTIVTTVLMESTLDQIQSAWCVLDGREVAGLGYQLIAVFGHNLSLAQSDYGKTWLAYTHKPGGGGAT